jgi:NADPH2:quinone reductase
MPVHCYGKPCDVERIERIADIHGLKVVYDSVGKDTFLKSLDCLQPFGLIANFGNASGKVEPLDLAVLAGKGSLYATRPTIFTHLATRESTQAMADDLFEMVISGKVKIPIDQRFALADVAEAHRSLEARKTTGCTIFTL